MDFFAGAGNNPDDIYAWHYFADEPAWNSQRDKVNKPSDYGKYRTAVNKLAAHLTYSRIDFASSEPLPPSLATTEYLLGLANLFMRLLPAERVAWFGGLSL